MKSITVLQPKKYIAAMRIIVGLYRQTLGLLHQHFISCWHQLLLPAIRKWEIPTVFSLLITFYLSQISNESTMSKNIFLCWSELNESINSSIWTRNEFLLIYWTLMLVPQMFCWSSVNLNWSLTNTRRKTMSDLMSVCRATYVVLQY